MKEPHPVEVSRVGVGCHTSYKAIRMLKSQEVSQRSCHRFQWHDNDQVDGSLNACDDLYNSEDHFFKVNLHNGWPSKNNRECS